MEKVTRRMSRIGALLLALALLVTSGPAMTVISMKAYAVDNNETAMNESVSENEDAAEEANAPEEVDDDRSSDEAAKEDETEPEEAAAGDSFEAGKLTAGSDDCEIRLDYDADAEIPSAASLDVKEISSNTKEYSEYVEAAADEVTDKHIEADSLPYARFFDISILNEDGDEIEPAAPVSVSIELKDKALDTEDVEFAAVHFTDDKNNQAETVPVEIKNEELSFEADSFSVYGVVYYYTVDFYYTSKDNKASEHHMNGGSEMMLSELFDKLDITRKTADIKKVDFTDDSLLSFTNRGNDYLIKSLKAFTSGEVLTITFNDGEIIVIRVEDDVNVTDWATLKAAVEAAVEAGGTQTITLTSDITAGNDTITVPDVADITIAGNYKITRNATESSDVKAMFTVNGKLTLQNVTLSGGNAVYGKAMINSKTRGFFVEVNESGTLNIEGAKLQDYKTPETSAEIPVGVSPVYVKGSFNMKSGSISNNEAGAWWKSWFEETGTVPSINKSIKDNSSLKDDNDFGINPNGYAAVETLASKSVLSRTNSGAIFFDGANAKYTIDGSADISNNEGHAGAIVVAGGQLTIKGNAKISNNYGDHDSTIFVASSDAEVRMCGGLLQSNKSTNGGGVLAADDGKFFLMGGTIDNNYSYNTGGGILIYSNNVHIISGKITNNKSAVFGGGIYVYGEDSGQASFTTVISSADIRNNRAVYTEGNQATSDSRDAGIISGDGNVTIKGAEEFARGSGGGIWLCPAGIATFDMTSVNLQGNTADYQNADFHKDAGFLGGVLIDFGPHDRLTGWKHDEASVRGGGSAEQFTEAEATSGQAAMLGLKNEGQTYVQNPKVEISGNASRRGGGVGSDGTVLFFTPDGENINIDKGSLSYEKTFVDMDSDKMEYEMILADEDGKPELNDDGDEIVVAQFRLYDKEYADTYETKRQTFGTDIYGQGKAEWENNYQKINIEFPKGNDDANFITETDDGAEFNIIMREYKVKDDNTRGAEVSERFFSSDDPAFVDKTDVVFETIKYYQDAQGCDGTGDCNCDPGEAQTFEIHKRKFNFSATATNKETPEIEKYVNEAVHSDIALQDEFTYNILAYVTTNADKVVITDKLNEQLEFVSGTSDVKVYDLGTKEENGQEVPIDSNHLPVYDVSGDKIDHKGVTPSVQTGKAITIKDNEYSKVDISDDTLTVTLANELNDDGSRKTDNQELKDLYGHYIRIEFKAKIKSNLSISELEYNEIKADEEYKDGVNGEERGKPYTGNDPVKSDEDHTGIINAASYAINVGNVAKYQDSSNTVTVKPDQPEIEKYVNQAVHKYIDLDEVFTYDIIAYITKDADEVTITDELDSQLQFVSEAGDIAVADLGTEDNHKVTNNIDAKKVNKDATVAEDGETIKDADISIDGQKLQVRIANAADYRGHWVKVKFDAKIKDGLTTGDLTYTQIDADAAEDRDGPNVGNAPVISDESHSGVPNKASYTIGVKNGAEIEEKYKDESNTVTVRPEDFEIEVSKQDLDGNDVPGAKLVVLDSRGIEVESWTTESAPHALKLKAGDYMLREASAPRGLKLISTPVKFSVDAKGKVSLKTKSVDNGGKVSVTGTCINLMDAPVDTDLQKFVDFEKKAQKLKSKDETVEFRIVATVPYGVSKFEITDPIPKPLLYVEDSLQIFIDGELYDESSAVMATESPDYVAIAITSENDGTIDVSEVYGRDVAITFECKLDSNADLSKYEGAVNTAYLFLDDSDIPVDSDENAQASVLGISELADDNPTEYTDTKKKGANTGDNTPIELALFGLIASAAAFVIIRRRREN